MKRVFIRRAAVVFLLTVVTIGLVGIVDKYIFKSQQTVEIVSERVLIPGGQSVGIRMNVKGVLVVGLEEIECADRIVSPGYDAGIQIGDIITSINNIPVYYASDVTDMVNNSPDELKIKVTRKDKELRFNVRPAKDHSSGEYKLGIWVKEKIAGIGTLTFYDPETNTFAALGHGIYESKTGTLLEVGDGELLKTEVRSIKEGEAGTPGEIRGIFCSDNAPLGKVVKNSQYGVYSMGENFDTLQTTQPIVMAYQDQIELGPAYILTTIDGEEKEQFQIEITKINRQKEADIKGLEIKVTDDRLLSSCGGIIQGMSGSPIIQNNRLVGAVTHVFVNNPTRGYGIFAEWMVATAENN